MTNLRRHVLVVVVAISVCVGGHAEEGRTIPLASPQSPGNVFVEGADVNVPISGAWRLEDERGELLSEGRVDPSGVARLGKLGVGWYSLSWSNADAVPTGTVALAVLAVLKAPVPRDSPVCIDAALAWTEVEHEAQREQLARLAALAGANWIRDRLRWREMEPDAGAFAPDTKYDRTARDQAACGLSVLQVFHGTPAWAAGGGEDRSRFPPDLRAAYRFCREMARRFRGSVRAWEPWNEGNAHNFGGHAIDEMCAYQKACYLGFKAGDPTVTVGWNPIGGINTSGLVRGILDNETWPYYDTYNIHSYDWPHAFDGLWESARRAACGRPIWVTEADRGMKAQADSDDFSPEFARRKAEYMAQSYACSLYAGASRHFHFILGHYMEQSIQFGLLRKDLTPRPSYVALAALGRFLAGGRCLGRWELPGAHVYAFNASPDGVGRDVLVAWAEEPVDWKDRGKARVPWALPEGLDADAAFDYLGRRLPGVPEALQSAPVFVLLPTGVAQRLPLAAPKRSDYRQGEPPPVVMQAHVGEGRLVMKKEAWTEEHYRAVEPGQDVAVRVNVYNFAEQSVAGAVNVEALPDGWALSPRSWETTIDPMGRAVVEARLRLPDAAIVKPPAGWIQLRGDFGARGRPVVAFQVITPEQDSPAS